MEKKRNAAQEWLETATRGIRFGPDRLAVEAELREHLEDKTADMARIFHIEGEEAEREALKRMGDPEEIGKKLAKIHKPWLGYLWLASKIACCVLIPLALFYLSLLDHYGDNVQSGMGYKSARSLETPEDGGWSDLWYDGASYTLRAYGGLDGELILEQEGTIPKGVL